MISNRNLKVGVLGLGGVGGYIGGKLAAHYYSSDTKVFFLAKEEQAKVIEKDGLQLSTSEGQLVARPAKATANPTEIEVLDLLFVCVKTYDLEKSLLALKKIISPSTVIIPLVNGLSASATIRSVVNAADVWEGCIYLVSRLLQPGIIRQTGNLNRMYFGSGAASREQLISIEQLLKAAGINACHRDQMESVLWEKFFFISPLATLTSAYNLTVADILNSTNYQNLFESLLQELKKLAERKDIQLPSDLMQKAFQNVKQMPPSSSSSMHADFQKGRKTEMYSLTGYVVDLARECEIEVPTYQSMYDSLVNTTYSDPDNDILG